MVFHNGSELKVPESYSEFEGIWLLKLQIAYPYFKTSNPASPSISIEVQYYQESKFYLISKCFCFICWLHKLPCSLKNRSWIDLISLQSKCLLLQTGIRENKSCKKIIRITQNILLLNIYLTSFYISLLFSKPSLDLILNFGYYLDSLVWSRLTDC